MVSLSPSITTSLNMSPVIGPRLYLDVIHRTGELNTVVLTASGAGFSETTSVKTHFQAGGHDSKILNLIRHTSVPLLLTSDEDNNLILWRCQNGRLEQLAKYKMRKNIQLNWLDVSPTNNQLYLGGFSNLSVKFFITITTELFPLGSCRGYHIRLYHLVITNDSLVDTH